MIGRYIDVFDRRRPAGEWPVNDRVRVFPNIMYVGEKG